MIAFGKSVCVSELGANIWCWNPNSLHLCLSLWVTVGPWMWNTVIFFFNKAQVLVQKCSKTWIRSAAQRVWKFSHSSPACCTTHSSVCFLCGLPFSIYVGHRGNTQYQLLLLVQSGLFQLERPRPFVHHTLNRSAVLIDENVFESLDRPAFLGAPFVHPILFWLFLAVRVINLGGGRQMCSHWDRCPWLVSDYSSLSPSVSLFNSDIRQLAWTEFSRATPILLICRVRNRESIGGLFPKFK